MTSRIVLLLTTLLALQLPRIRAGQSVDVQEAFAAAARQYCGQSVAVCDIGSGNVCNGESKMSIGNQSLANATVSRGFGVPFNSSASDCEEKADHTCQVVSSGAHEWCDFNWKCLGYTVTYDNQAYSDITTNTDPSAPGYAFINWADNETPTEQHSELDFTDTVGQSATLTLTNTVALGITASMTVGVPDVMSATFSETLTVTTSSSTANTKTQSQAVSARAPITVPAHSTIKATMTVQKQTVRGKFTATAHFPATGYAKLWCESQVQGHNEWFVPAAGFLPDAYPDSCHLEGDGVACQIAGDFEGWHGTTITTDFKECPLKSRDC